MSLTRNNQEFSRAESAPARAAAIMEELIPALQGAARGSRRLDLLIAFALGRCSVGSRTVLHALLQDEVLPAHVVDLLDAECPGYTTALDAAVPGENIVLAVYQDTHARWAAVQRATLGQETVGQGASEVLARRIAALKALLPAMAMQPAPPPIPPAPTAKPPAAARPAPSPASPPAASVAAADVPAGLREARPQAKPAQGSSRRQGGDWEILW